MRFYRNVNISKYESRAAFVLEKGIIPHCMAPSELWASLVAQTVKRETWV